MDEIAVCFIVSKKSKLCSDNLQFHSDKLLCTASGFEVCWFCRWRLRLIQHKWNMKSGVIFRRSGCFIGGSMERDSQWGSPSRRAALALLSWSSPHNSAVHTYRQTLVIFLLDLYNSLAVAKVVLMTAQQCTQELWSVPLWVKKSSCERR